MSQSAELFCSTIVPTVARDCLNETVDSVLSQQWSVGDAEQLHELIVVNDSGKPLRPAQWHSDPRVTIFNTNQRERCVARNFGAAAAKGTYLHFLDDDDLLLPGALQAFWHAAQGNSAEWIAGATEIANRERLVEKIIRHNLPANCFVQAVAGEWVPLCSSLMKADRFFEVGGFTPTFEGAEDVDFWRKYALIGTASFFDTPVARIHMGVENSTTNYAIQAERSHRLRERLLDNADALQRMVATADNGYWYGRISRAYLTSALWNLRHRRPVVALSHFGRGVFGGLRAGRQLFSADFRRAILHPYQSMSFAEAQLVSTSIQR